MPNLAGKSTPLKRLSDTPGLDEKFSRALRSLEDKAEELESRLKDLERRVAAGGL